MLSAALVLFLAAAPALAHFHLNYPPPRGPFVAQKELSFCSSYPTGARSPFSIDNGLVDITSSHPSAMVQVVISFDNDPTTFTQFNQTGDGTAYPPLVPTFSMNYQGELCMPVDAERVGVPVVNGTNATIQVYFNGGDGVLYDCADVVLITNYTTPSNVSCSNTTASSSSSSTGSSASASPTGGNSSSTGAGVALAPGSVGAAAAVLLAVAGALVFSV